MAGRLSGSLPRRLTEAHSFSLLVSLPGRPTARSPDCLTTWLPDCPGARLPGHLAARLPDCLLACCLATWPPGCLCRLATWIPDHLAALSPNLPGGRRTGCSAPWLACCLNPTKFLWVNLRRSEGPWRQEAQEESGQHGHLWASWLPAGLPGCLAAWLPGGLTLLRPGGLTFWRPGCLAVWLAGGLPGCLPASVRACLPWLKPGSRNIPVCLNKTLLRRRRHVKMLASGTPNQGPESSFCCWTAGQGLAQKECILHRHR